MDIESLKCMEIDTDEIERIIKGYHSGQKNIVVTGEFSSGKSSFINCFINRKAFLPYGKTECTPILIDICKGNEGKIEVRKNDGSVYNEELSNANIVKYAKYVEGIESDVVSLAIPLTNPGLPENTHLIDTPGTNTILKEHEEITRFIIKRADAVLYLFNRVISKSDVEHINDILQHTPNIIFILTHSDEIDTKTGQKYSKERIGELLEEARKEISAGTKINAEDLIMCSVGSEYGFEDRNEIEGIKKLVSSYIASQTDSRRKRVAQKKIEKILQTALDGYMLKNDFFAKQKKMSEHEIESKIRLFEQEQANYEKKHNNRIDDIDRRILQQEELCRSELSRMLIDEQSKITSLISEGYVNEKNVEKQLESFNLEISNKMRNIIEKSITTIAKEAYDSANSCLSKIASNFDVSVPLVLSVPDIQELDSSRISSQLAGVEKQIEDNLRELKYLEENSTEKEKVELEKKIRECELQKEDMSDKLLQLGVYHPEFIAVENEGGGNTGKITGRIIGEVADLALLIWNPAGAAKGATEAVKVVSAADKAKDTATIVRYIKNAASKAAKTGKEVNEKKEKMKKIGTTIKKVDAGRREIIEHVQENSDEEGKDEMILSTMLDMLSIGHWTEKVGGVIGEAIRPSTTSFVENMDNKTLYESKKADIISESNRLSNELYDLKCQLNEVDDFGKQLRIENQIREKNKALEDKKNQLEEMKIRAEKKNADDQMKQYLETQFDEYERSQMDKGLQLIKAILDEAKNKIIESLTSDYYEKLGYYKETIAGLRDKSLSETGEMVECEEKISVLRQSLSEIEVWLE